MNYRLGGMLWVVCLAPLGAQVAPPAVQEAIVQDVARTSAERVRALSALQDQGALPVPLLLTVLGDADARLAGAAAAILRHEWLEFPAPLLQGLVANRRAAVCLLRELAMAPRPAARPFVREFLLRQDLSPGERCLALAARGEPLRGAEVGEIVAALLEDQVAAETYAASALLEPASADALAGRLHALLDRGNCRWADPAAARTHVARVVMLPCWRRAQLAGGRSGRVVPVFAADSAGGGAPAHGCAMLDGSEPLLACFLLQAEKVLQQAQRRERLLAVLEDPAAPPGLAERAFAALVAAGCVEPAVLAFAASDDQPAHGTARPCCWELPLSNCRKQTLREWLQADPELMLDAGRVAASRPGARVRARGAGFAAGGQIPVGLAMTQAALPLILRRGGAEAIDALQGAAARECCSWRARSTVLASPGAVCHRFVAALAGAGHCCGCCRE
jgi:hypothetical protein